MQTHVISTTARPRRRRRSSTRPRATQQVLIVNGSGDVLDVLEPVLDAGNYDVVFVESSAHAYSQIRRVQPDLVILCLEMDDAEGLRVLSMLKLDEETRDIPVVTYTTRRRRGAGRRRGGRVEPSDVRAPASSPDELTWYSRAA